MTPNKIAKILESNWASLKWRPSTAGSFYGDHPKFQVYLRPDGQWQLYTAGDHKGQAFMLGGGLEAVCARVAEDFERQVAEMKKQSEASAIEALVAMADPEEEEDEGGESADNPLAFEE